MRTAFSAAFFAVAACAQAISNETLTGLTTAAQACSTPLIPILSSDPVCQLQMSAMATAMSQTADQTAIRTFCSSSCFPLFNRYYTQYGQCMQKYAPALKAGLVKDNVTNPDTMTTQLIAPYSQMSDFFSLVYCASNERGDMCLTSFATMSKDIASAISNQSSVCSAYFNAGCCLTSLSNAMAAMTSGVSSLQASLALVCPGWAAFAPPPCVSYGQSAAALNVALPLNGLDCTAFNAQNVTFQQAFDAALKTDLAAVGLTPSYTTVASVSVVGGVCTANLVLRANTDANTMQMKTAASMAQTATLTQTNGVLATAPTPITTGSLTLGTPTVTQTTVKGQALGSSNSGSLMAPSLFLGVMSAVVALILQ